MQGQLIFFSQLHYNLSMKEEYLINQQPLTLKKKIPQQDPSQPVNPHINSFYPKMNHFGRNLS